MSEIEAQNWADNSETLARLAINSIAEKFHARRSISPLTRARGLYDAMTALRWTRSQIAEASGFPKSTITKLFDLLELPDEVQDLVEQGKLYWSTARQIQMSGLRDTEKIAFAREAVERKWTGDQVQATLGLRYPSDRRLLSSEDLATFSETASLTHQGISLRGIGWEEYTRLLRHRGERSVPKMVYLDGDLFLVAPSFPHDRLKARLRWIVMEVAVGLDIPCTPAGQTTFRHQSKEAGIEGEGIFYFANESYIRANERVIQDDGWFDLRVDPPPDLVIEAVFEDGLDAAAEVYRRLGVPEVWFFDEEEFGIFVLGADGYADSQSSGIYPFLTASEINEWVRRPRTMSETQWMRDLRRWVSETLPARRGGQP